ncbi:MAG: hypothetical protein A3H71_02200 [Candidatus Sungbacteria bacterium RIFCSPLOWO2_02_FULL_48_13b]|uniref:Uncharacterized protein n=2 Tax=Candidatus Sungiibacteriota TaxID=1817917 RepID=A0A1G2LG84_9BACT|nr:MAG: hypothetical protein A3C12_03085 [Candidatus Sungbacteria bacterium RIFCSPHIGHO2_02_FULL_49_20]OHA09829.1 MAG: hypothetical protein A3H71_02200 [Candidatus Sungbacteria bacterium RIFCSPLOWO2_02_FULL_48_13b]
MVTEPTDRWRGVGVNVQWDVKRSASPLENKLQWGRRRWSCHVSGDATLVSSLQRLFLKISAEWTNWCLPVWGERGDVFSVEMERATALADSA